MGDTGGITYEELKEWVLTNLDIDDIILILQIDAEEILDRFEDKVESKFDELAEEANYDLLRISGQQEEVYDES